MKIKRKAVENMDLTGMLQSLENCPCGRTHTFYTKAIEIGGDVTARAGRILRSNGFDDEMLLVADENTIAASGNLRDVLRASGFRLTEKIYENLTYARAEQVEEIKELAKDIPCILSVGTGSLNDICRVASYQLQKKFAIYATAPSMDGFASDTAPIIKDNFKTSWQAEQPLVILGDTKVLAAAPA
ncbi:MAG: iron-containing alcohol dehydrogenase, partial [Ruminococcus sp.]|nr:iron-containing alcohol dehydrogenase [Candidatus Apopatosoma intestinale]